MQIMLLNTYTILRNKSVLKFMHLNFPS
uniref:Uncharacterized protein n=1 Tax=Rhizophora mucronata TaxID=61149 RepID=A0A2P2NTR2_RHIMU